MERLPTETQKKPNLSEITNIAEIFLIKLNIRLYEQDVESIYILALQIALKLGKLESCTIIFALLPAGA